MKFQFSFAIFLFFINSYAQTTVESHMLGHSLMDHSSPTQQTKIAYWIHQFATEAGHTYESTGQFGSIWDFANFNPQSNWGSPGIPSSWDSSSETFAAANLNNFMFTVFNYVQDLPPDEVYYTLPSSVLTASERLIDSIHNYQPGDDIFIYENWPDMAPFTAETPFEPTAAEYTAYNTYLLGDFHDWWIDLHDLVITSHPADQVKMIPVGPVIAELMNSAPYDTITVNLLYEDNAPHGRESIYFLAGLATYMGIFGEKAPNTYTVPSSIHPLISANYSAIIDEFWDYFIAFNDANGNNRVFGTPTSTSDVDNDNVDDSIDNCVNTYNPDQADYDNDGVGDLCDTPLNKVIVDLGVLYTEDAEGILMKGRDGNCYLLYINEMGVLTTEARPCP
ncbi:hypothetical protein [Portibacter lacus]|nr:hypothetical protein [Portibacter lacus]